MKTFYRTLIEPLVQDLWDKENRGLAWTFLGLAALFLLYLYLGKYAFLTKSGYGMLTGQTRSFYRYVGWFLSCFFFLFVVPVAFIGLHPRLKMKDFGLGLGDLKYAGKIALVFSGVMIIMVVILVLSKNKTFLNYYPMFVKRLSPARQPGHFLFKNFAMYFIIFEISYFIYFIGWEFFFRSLLIFPLEKRLGNMAVIAGILPFAIMHAGGKPIAEAFGSIIAAYLLGILVLKVRSFWICPVIHFMVAFSMDISSALSRGLL